MQKLTREDLMPLETYSVERNSFREKVINHKQFRRIGLGPNLNLYFEDRLTMQYQIQEMLRVERIFEADAIQEELDTYNALIPDGTNLKATMMLEYVDIEQRRQALTQLIGIENTLWLQVGSGGKVYAIADEDLERSDDDKTSAVHFIRLELGEAAHLARSGAKIKLGVDHANYQHELELTEDQHNALVADLN
ncbi:MAG: hypothetical protein ACI8P9_004909 [Parasphingorhabdus sp.]|jgi:hypothetical protein